MKSGNDGNNEAARTSRDQITGAFGLGVRLAMGSEGKTVQGVSQLTELPFT